MNQYGQTICLVMIVKNEAPVLTRCLQSVLPLIDHWIIIDTGSFDNTKEIITNELAQVPGELLERPWVNFAVNRNQALAIARDHCDYLGLENSNYLLLMDADDQLIYDNNFMVPQLTADSYDLVLQYDQIIYSSRRLVRACLPWRYIGMVHEYIQCDHPYSSAVLPGVRMQINHEGARARDPLTYQRDALIIQQALLDEPNNSRYMFYLAQSYRDAGELDLALAYYQKRVGMGGWLDEVWYSWYQSAIIKERLGHSWTEVLPTYQTAILTQGDRAEPYYRIGLKYNQHQEFRIAHVYFQYALTIPNPGISRLYIEQSIYDYLLPLEYAVTCHYLGLYQVALDTNHRLLTLGIMPDDIAELVLRNCEYSERALAAV